MIAISITITAIVFAISTTALPTDNYHEIILPQFGTILTNKGIAVNSHTDVFIAVRSNLNLETSYPSKENCIEWNTIRTEIKNAEKQFFRNIEDTIPCHFKISATQTISCANNTRSKRNIFSFLLGLGSFGLGIANMVQQHRLASSVEQLRQHENLLTSELNTMRS